MTSIRSELNDLIVGVYRSRDSTLAGLFSIFCTLLSIACAATAAEFLSSLIPQSGIIFRITAIIWIGTRLRALGNMMHECSHGIFVRNPLDNTRLGHLLAALDLVCFKDYVHQHTSHHAYLGNPERDLDLRSRIFLINRQKNILSTVYVCISAAILVPLWFSMLRPVLWTRQAPLWSNLLRLAVALGMLTLLLHPASSLLTATYLVVPYLTTYQWMRFLSDACDHLFLTSHPDPLQRSRNHLFKGRILNACFFPRNDAYHLLHHLFPSLPTNVYADAHKRLLQHPWYRSREHFLFNQNVVTSQTEGSFLQGQSR